MPAVRCSTPPRAQPSLPRGTSISMTLRDHHNFSLGIYCAVGAAGTVRLGNEVIVG
jgi:hypothetical protein